MVELTRRTVLSGAGGVIGAGTIGTGTATERRGDDFRTRQSTIRVLSYNIHSGIGTDGEYDLHRIANVIAAVDPDVVALQEVDDQNRAPWQDESPTNWDAQHELLSDWLDMDFVAFGAHRDWPVDDSRRRGGNVVLSHRPILESTIYTYSDQESDVTDRNVVETRLDFFGSDVWLYNTHLNQNQGEYTSAQANELLAIADTRSGPRLLAGDFNMFYKDDTYETVADAYTDVLAEVGEDVPTAPTRSDSPWGPYRLDYLFASDSIGVRSGKRITHGADNAPSDHYPIVADVTIPNENRKRNP